MIYSQVAEAGSERLEPSADVVPIGKDDFYSKLYFHTARSFVSAWKNIFTLHGKFYLFILATFFDTPLDCFLAGLIDDRVFK
jgi:hypothetical protein